jgi:hypothetical protein
MPSKSTDAESSLGFTLQSHAHTIRSRTASKQHGTRQVRVISMDGRTNPTAPRRYQQYVLGARIRELARVGRALGSGCDPSPVQNPVAGSSALSTAVSAAWILVHARSPEMRGNGEGLHQPLQS